MYSHDDDHDVEGVQEPVVDHLQVGGLRHHLVDGGLDRGNNHHRRDGDHNPVEYIDSRLSAVFWIRSIFNRIWILDPVFKIIDPSQN